MVTTVIDGREVTVRRDRWAIDVARELGIAIPTLCYHPALEPYGACRLCVVEVSRGRWTWLTTACDLPIREGLKIRTDTPEVRQARRLAAELLWAQAPASEEIAVLARSMGVEKPRFPSRDPENQCILCGLCVRVCETLIGASAIGFAHRGTGRTVGSPSQQGQDAGGQPCPDGQVSTCLGCGACVAVCPTGHVRMLDVIRATEAVRKMATWSTELPMARCESCGAPFAAERLLEVLRERLPEHLPLVRLCQACRRSQTAGKMSTERTEQK